MAMSLRDGDYHLDGKGDFYCTSAKEELLERVLLKLTAKCGKFPFLPSFGSDLYLLPRQKDSAREQYAKNCVEAALADEADLSLEEIVWEDGELEVYLQWQGESLTFSLTVYE